jgi:Flp pilus assembly protein TadD
MFHYQKSLAVNSAYLPARVALAEVFLSKGRIADAKEEVRKALELRSDFVPARLLKATLDRSDRNYEAAEQELSALAKEQPGNALVFRHMGIYYDSRGRTAEAEKYWMQALELQPDSQEILRDLVFFYIRGKQTGRAIQTINAIPEEKKQGFHYELLGLVYSQAGKSVDAERAYRRALEKDPGRSTPDIYLFAEHMKNGRTDEALTVLDGVVKKNPGNPSAYAVKAQVLEGQGKIEEAKDLYDRALEVDPNFDGAANNLAYILAEQGVDLQRALGHAQTARRKYPDNLDIADTLGWVYYKLGNHVLARDQLQFAVSKQPDNPIFQYHLGMVYTANKQIREAESAFRKAANSKRDVKERSLALAILKELTKPN